MPYSDPEVRKFANREYYRSRRERLRGTPELRSEDRAKWRNQIIKLRQWVRSYKTSKGCVDCGYNAHHAALDFDHIGTHKTSNVSKLRTLKRVREEIEHCVVRCANCHRVKTYEERREEPK